MKQPHTEESAQHSDDQQNTGNHKKPGQPDTHGADRFGGRERCMIVIALPTIRRTPIMATIASVREIPSTQRTTPVVRPCRASVAVFTVGRPSDIAAIPLLR